MAIKWDYISNEEKEVVFKHIEIYKSPEFKLKDGVEKKKLLTKLFKFYNEYVSPTYSGSFTCGTCINNVIKFFNKYYKQWQIEGQ